MTSRETPFSAPVGAAQYGGTRAVSRCDSLGVAPYSEEEGALFRPYLSKAYRETVRCVSAWMEEAGMTTRQDAAGNLVGRYEGARPDAPALLIGSHLDSVRNAGRYDGPLGVMLGIEVVAYLSAHKKRLPFAVEVIGFGDEEGSRFPVSMLTSRAVAGLLKAAPDTMKDAAGISLRDALGAEGFLLEDFSKAARNKKDVIAYFEAHIEQGPVLESENHAVGAVTAIAAQYRFLISIKGFAGHAGTMPMHLRQDALAAAAEAMVTIESIALQGVGDLVATVGRLDVAPGVPNVVPGDVAFTLDIRSGTESIRDKAAETIRTTLAAIAEKRHVELSMELQQDLPATPCNPALTNTLSDAIQKITGLSARKLVSGAGHDAMVMAALAPVCMLFIRCEKGISHNPAEAVTAEDVEIAFQVMVTFIESYAETYSAAQEKIA
ncbi:allantoate amidohydrolase [Acetobacter sp.]|uniref:allantoate amidohydrolase n=1 Tax=Acetobacter sp. TaxID=440 RepID=UPI00258DD0D6|nr:allantoate amidohydrolase [Acetobacter sp.]MCC6105900.1 allantoate amidohydrolase [Acetobacter sp.]